ncbi:MAG: peroxiredoxin, partial [Lentilactobacillus parabuchneri]|nr:peroxiredoxin [Lentilactobacillus parabuchneri]
MNFIGKEIDDFKVNAFQDGDVKQVTKKDLLGHWSI